MNWSFRLNPQLTFPIPLNHADQADQLFQPPRGRRGAWPRHGEATAATFPIGMSRRATATYTRMVHSLLRLYLSLHCLMLVQALRGSIPRGGEALIPYNETPTDAALAPSRHPRHETAPSSPRRDS